MFSRVSLEYTTPDGLFGVLMITAFVFSLIFSSNSFKFGWKVSVFGEITTGASNDIEQATKLARAMLTRYGMSDEFGMVALETVTNQYLGGDASLACSPESQAKIDRLVVELVERQHQKALQILRDDRQKLDELARFLHEKETITGEEFMSILNA